MRYCSQCGNPLSAGASFCHSCGAALKAVVPEADETPVAAPVTEEPEVVTPVAEEPVVEPPAEEPVVEAPAAAPVVVDGNENEQIKEEREFLDATHRFLRWERKAWSITGKVLLIFGIVLAALLCIVGIAVGAASGEIAATIILIMYAIVYGVILIGGGIVNLKAGGKIAQYTDTLYKDFSIANKRCNSIGMIIFTYFFNSIALVFFVINFARMKCNKQLIDRILTRQGVK